MDRHPSGYSASFAKSLQSNVREYQLNNDNRSTSLNGTFRSPSQYSEWSLPSSTELESVNNDFDASPPPTSSQTNLRTPSWDRNYNPFDISFSRYSSLPNEVSPLTPNYVAGAHQTWLASPTPSTEQSHSSPKHIFSPYKAPIDAGFLAYEPARQIEIEIPVLSLPINIVASRKRNTKGSRTLNRGIKKENRTTTKVHRPRQDLPVTATQPHRDVAVFACLPADVAQDDRFMEASNAKPEHSKGEEGKERHKYVEMKYRMQMKDRFEELLRALPEQNGPLFGERSPKKAELDKKMTRGKVLDLAREHIDSLDKTRRILEKERDMLKYQVGLYEAACLSTGRSVLEG